MDNGMSSRETTSAEEIIDFAHKLSTIASTLAANAGDKLNPILIPSCDKVVQIGRAHV